MVCVKVPSQRFLQWRIAWDAPQVDPLHHFQDAMVDRGD